MAWSPDGRYVVASRGVTLDLIVVASGRRIPLTSLGFLSSPALRAR